MTKILNETREHSTVLPSSGRGTDHFSAAIPAGEVFHSCRLTILDSHLRGGAAIAAQPSEGQSANAQVAVDWRYGASGKIKYQVEAFSRPAGAPSTGTNTITSHFSGFLPSRSGFHFDNSFPAVPDLVFKTPFGNLNIGDASKGLCGGMVYAALDYFKAGLPIPTDERPPGGGALFDYIVQRLLYSFDLPLGVLKYVELMDPKYPDYQSTSGRYGAILRGRAWRMIREEWPAIKVRLDAGQPCPLGLIRIKSTDLTQLGQNHQVLTYGYDVSGDVLTLYIYDPNYHDDDRISLTLNLADAERAPQVRYSTAEPLFCFFLTRYTFSMPPIESKVPGRILLFEDHDFGGRMKDVQAANPDLARSDDGFFGDRVSSFVVLSGNWSFYRNARFDAPFLRGAQPLVLGPGSYPGVEALGIQDNEISSLRAVADAVNG